MTYSCQFLKRHLWHHIFRILHHPKEPNSVQIFKPTFHVCKVLINFKWLRRKSSSTFIDYNWTIDSFLDHNVSNKHVNILVCFIFKYYIIQQKGGEGTQKKGKKERGGGGGRGDGLTWACQIQSIPGKEGLWESIPNETKSFAYAEANATQAYIYSRDSTLIIQSTYFLTIQHGNKTHTVFINKGGTAVLVLKSKALASWWKVSPTL